MDANTSGRIVITTSVLFAAKYTVSRGSLSSLLEVIRGVSYG